MTRSPLISFVVPVYSIRPEYLRTSIESMLQQTYDTIEIILVDDGSPDQCGEICDGYAAQDSRIQVIHQPNSGVSAARNAGLDRAAGEYIAFVDPDDFLDPAYLEKLLQAMPDDADILSCCCTIVGEDFTDIDHFFDGSQTFCGTEGKKPLYFQLMQNAYGQPQRAYTAIGVPWGKLYRAAFLKETGLRFDPGLPRMQDNLFNMYAFHAARKVVYLDSPLYQYRYEHISGYRKTGADYIRIFGAVAEARYACLTQTGLMADPEIRAHYQEEAAQRLVSLLRQGVFVPDSPAGFAGKKQQAEELTRRPWAAEMLRDYRGEGWKMRVWLFPVKHHMWHLADLMYRLQRIRAKIRR